MDSTQVLINSLATANSAEELRNRLIPLLTRVAEAAPSEGITSITSDSLEVTTPSVGVRNIEGMSGTFTPTISNISPSAVTVPTVSNMIYQKVGNVVTCSFYFECNFPIGETSVAFNFTLPIASNFTASTDLIGSISHDVADNDTWVTVSANDTLNLGSIFGVGAAETNFNSYVTFQYIVI